MSEEQRLHTELLVKQFTELMTKKYEAGTREHAGNIWDLPKEQLLDEAINEAIDQVVYLLTLKANL